MTLQDIFDALSAGELSQISIGGQAAGVINKENRAKLLPHINMGLTALFKRFRLKEGELTIQLEAAEPGIRWPVSSAKVLVVSLVLLSSWTAPILLWMTCSR